MAVDLHAEGLQPLLEKLRRRLAAVVGYDNAADVQADAAERVDKAQGVLIVCNAQIAAALVALDVVGGDGDDDLGVVLHLKEHLYLAVGLKAGQHAGRVIIVEELAAELQIQLAAELGYPVADIARLFAHIFGIVKSYRFHVSLSPVKTKITSKNYIPYRRLLSNILPASAGLGALPIRIRIVRIVFAISRLCPAAVIGTPKKRQLMFSTRVKKLS